MMQLLIDGRCDPIPILETALPSLRGLCRCIKMSPLGPPIPRSVADGFTLVQIIIESHIVIHVQDNFINIDIFSCKPFDDKAAIRFCRGAFNIIEPFKHQVLDRKFGKEMAHAKA